MASRLTRTCPSLGGFPGGGEIRDRIKGTQALGNMTAHQNGPQLSVWAQWASKNGRSEGEDSPPSSAELQTVCIRKEAEDQEKHQGEGFTFPVLLIG